jgi:hypothetical protein
MTENANTPQVTDRQEQMLEAQESPQSTFSTEVANKCLEVVQQFHTGERDKASAILQIQRHILRESDEDTNFVQAFGSYCEMLDNFERYNGAAGQSQMLEDTNQTHRQDVVRTERDDEEVVDQLSK